MEQWKIVIGEAAVTAASKLIAAIVVVSMVTYQINEVLEHAKQRLKDARAKS